MNVLVLNCGSSSLRFQVIATDVRAIDAGTERRLVHGLVERIGSEALITLRAGDGPPLRETAPMRDHRAALDWVLRWLVSPGSNVPIASLADLHAIGHRVVHGGENLRHSVLIDEAVIAQIEDCVPLAPLHNPANLRGIRAARELFGSGVPEVAVFDTSFHTTMPPESFLYAIPYPLYVRHRVRRYGFHGTSHRYLAWRYRQLTGRTEAQTNIITLHLGNGCSACAIKGGESLDTSMGMTPMEGLVMGTRAGDMDASVALFLHHTEGMSFEEIDAMLNKQSGLLGVSGLTNDMRDLLQEEQTHQDRRARLAIDIFCLRVRKYIGAYLARMNGAEAVVFSGGIGENAAAIRTRIAAEMDFVGLVIDPEANARTVGGAEGSISAAGARVQAWVIPTNEEMVIARDTVRCVEGAPNRW